MYVSRLHKAATLALAIAVVTAGSACLSAFAQKASTPTAFETKATHAVVMDGGANLMLFEKDAETLIVPASMSKIMTLAVLFREMKGEPFYRVRVGPFVDRKGAKAALSEVTKAGFQGAKIVKAD